MGKNVSASTYSSGLVTGKIPFGLRQETLVSINQDRLKPGGNFLVDRAIDVCSFTCNDLVLDIGCGNGMALAYFKDICGIQAIGIDPDPDMLKRACSKLKSAKSSKLIQAKLPYLPLKPGIANGILCESVLNISNDPASWLAECCRLLKKNGKLVIIDSYIRKWLPDEHEKGKIKPCKSGTVSMMKMLMRVEMAGFQIDLIEDHSRLLNQLGPPARDRKEGLTMIIAGKYR